MNRHIYMKNSGSCLNELNKTARHNYQTDLGNITLLYFKSYKKSCKKNTRRQILLYLHISGNKALAPILVSYRSLSIVIQINILILHSCRATQSRGWEKLLHDNFLLFVVGDGALWHNRLNIDTIVPMHQVKGSHKMVFNI